MTELSFFGELTSNLKLSKAGRVGMTLSYFDVIELLGELEALKLCIATLDSETVITKQKLTDCEARNKELELLAYGSEQEQLRRNALWGFGASGTSRYGD